ncbi:MAG TPA: hypothetical protein VGE69_15270 [Pseudomonadales bacterium]
MNARFTSMFARYLVICAAVAASGMVHAESHGIEARLSYRFAGWQLDLPAVRVGDRYYTVRMNSQELRIGSDAPSWTLADARRIPPVDADYLSGDYQGDVLELRCVDLLGELYSARLVATSAGAHEFTLDSHARLDACPKPADIGEVRGQWVRTAPSPLSPRALVSLSWTGSEIIVLGGTKTFRGPLADIIEPEGSLFADGAAYDPVSDSWRRIADVPDTLSGHSTASVGSSVFVFAMTSPRGGPFHLYRYRSPLDAWDEFALPEHSVLSDIEAVGDKLLLYAREDKYAVAYDWLLDPATGQWTRLPADPLETSTTRTYVVHGTDLYLFKRYFIDLPGVLDDRFVVRAARWRNGQWSVLPEPPSQPEVGLGIPTLVAGSRLIAPSLNCDTGDLTPHERCIPYGSVFDTETDTWHDLPAAPGGGLQFYPSGGGLSASQVVIGQLGRPALDATTDEWYVVPRLEAYDDLVMKPSMGGVGPYGFAYGGGNALGQIVGDSWIWKP